MVADLRPLDDLVFASGSLQALRTALLADAPLESAAFVYARPVRRPMGGWRLVAYDVWILAASEYAARSAVSIELSPAVVATAMQRARAEQSSVILVHTHPVGGRITPSMRDLAGERVLVPALQRRVPDVPHGRLILGRTDLDAAVFSPAASVPPAPLVAPLVADPTGITNLAPPALESRPLRVLEIGDQVTVYDPHGPPAAFALEPDAPLEFDRQVRAFGAAGQRRLSSLRVAVVGLGGTGSVVVQQLAHLGVGSLLLIDPDALERTNLNRVVGAARGDVGRSKVSIGADAVARVNPEIVTEGLLADIRDAHVVRRLLDTDFFFGCTDSQGSRAVLAQFAYQYSVPGIDLGVAIHAVDGQISHVSGRVQMLAPGLACVLCAGVLDPEAVRRDLLTDDARAADPYIVGAAVPQPAVISLNSATASLAVSMFLAAVTGIPLASRHLRLRFDAGKTSSVSTTPAPTCPWCSAHGYLLRGDQWMPPGRVAPPAAAAALSLAQGDAAELVR
ncbi:MAG: ThiF family adenylyltransferase [Gemmatimonadota bacterium]